MSKPRVFISYSSLDRPLAEQIHRELEAAGVQVWRDEKRLERDWSREIAEALIRDVDVICLIWSTNSAKSHWVQHEWLTARALEKGIIPCICENAPALPDALGHIHGVVLKPGSSPTEEFLKRLDTYDGSPVPFDFTLLPANSYIPFNPNSAFVGRLSELVNVYVNLVGNLRKVGVSLVGLVGMGGVGKTQLAVEFALRFAFGFDAVYWIDAADSGRWFNELVTLARSRLKLQVRDPQADDWKLQYFYALQDHLKQHPRSLLIFDNVTDPKMLNSEKALPGTRTTVLSLGCNVLFTSRTSAKVPGVTFIEVNLLSPEDSLALLTRQREPSDANDVNHAEAICSMLGFLPLAIVLANAFLCDKAHVSYGGYRKELERNRLRTVDRAEMSDEELATGHQAAVAATLQTQIDALQDDNARHLLRLATLFDDAERIPTGLLLHASGIGPGESEIDNPFEDALGRLRVLRLLDRTSDGVGLKLHPLLRACLRDEIGEAAERELKTQAVQRFAESGTTPEALERTYVERGINELLLDIATVFSWAGEETHTLSRLPLLFLVLRHASAGLRQKAAVDRALFFTQQVALHAAQMGYADIRSAAEARAREKGGAHFGLQWSSGVGISVVGQITPEESEVWQTVALSHDGNAIATCDNAGQLVLRDSRLGSRLVDFSVGVESVDRLAFIGDSYVLATASHSGAIKIWDVDSGTLFSELVTDANGLTDMTASHNSYHVVACFDDGSVKVWHIEDSDDVEGRQLVEPARPGESPPKFVRAVFHNDSLRVVTLSANGKLLAVNMEGKVEQRLDVGEGVQGLVISPCGEYAVILSGRQTAPVWHISTGETVGVLESAHPITDVAIASDAGFAVLSEFFGTISVIDWPPSGSPARVLGSHGGGGGAELEMLADGSFLVSVAHCELKIWQPSITWKSSTRPGHTARITELGHVPGTQLLISASWDQTVKVWDIRNGNIVRELRENKTRIDWLCLASGLVVTGGPGEMLELDLVEQKRTFEYDWRLNFSRMAVSPDGTKLVGTHLNGLVEVITADGSHKLGNHANRLDVVAVTEDGKYAFTGSGDGTIKRWDLETYGEDGHFSLHEEKVNALALIPGTTQLISGSRDGSFKLFDWKDGREIHAFSDKGEGPVIAVASSPDGQRVVAAGGYNVRLWDVATRRLVASCALWDKISCLRMPASNLLLAGDDSGNIYCLELER